MPKRRAPTDGFKYGGAQQKQTTREASSSSSSAPSQTDSASVSVAAECVRVADSDVSHDAPQNLALLVLHNHLLLKKILDYTTTASAFSALARLTPQTWQLVCAMPLLIPAAKVRFCKEQNTLLGSKKAPHGMRTYFTLPNSAKHGLETFVLRDVVVRETEWREGRKHGYEFSHDKEFNHSRTKDTLSLAHFRDNHHDGVEIVVHAHTNRVLLMTNWKAGHRHGLCQEWWPSGELQQRVGYVKGKKHGMVIAFYDSGRVRKTVCWVMGQQCGPEVWYYDDTEGAKKEEVYWKRDKLHGLDCKYYFNGTKSHECTWKEGKKDGVEIYYGFAGKKESERLWKDGKRNGPETLYHFNGKKRVEQFYREDKLHGPSIEYFDSGAIRRRGNYADDLSDGAWIWYWEYEKIKKTVTYKAGRAVGAALKFYTSGNLWYRNFYSQEDGQLIEEHEYYDTPEQQPLRFVQYVHEATPIYGKEHAIVCVYNPLGELVSKSVERAESQEWSALLVD